MRYEYVWPIVAGLSNALSPSFMCPRLQALVGFLGRICGYSSLRRYETVTSLRQASSAGVNSALILARSPTACSKGDLNYWSRLVTYDRSTALCVCLCLCRPSFHWSKLRHKHNHKHKKNKLARFSCAYAYALICLCRPSFHLLTHVLVLMLMRYWKPGA